MLTVGDGFRIVGANAAAHALLDRAPGALLGRTLIEAFLDTQVEAIAHAALEVGSATGEVRGRRGRRTEADAACPARTERRACGS